jgi:hypothetical protein
VYKARQTRLDRPVALKMVLASAAAGPEELGRFRREAEAIARLAHPNIVQVYEVGEHEGCPYLVLELLEGGSLADRLAGTPLPPRQAAELALALAGAVQHAHEKGVIHRDLKPGNVLLTADGVPKIADFGLAKRLGTNRAQTETGVIAGTPSYMAPEQAQGRGKDVGPATDVYALGAILYELLTGRPPFKAATVLQTLEQVRSHDPPRPATLQPGLPADLETVCLKCLHKEPAYRYRSAAALAADLGSFLAGEPISARRLTPLERLSRVVRFSGVPAHMRSWSSTMLLLAPVPVVLQLLLLLLFGGWPSYPLIVVAVGLLAAAACAPLVLWPVLGSLRKVPRFYRRYVWSLMVTRWAGWLLVPAIVALMRPGDDPAEFYLVFPLWAFLDGNFYCMIGSEAGVAYPVALVHYAAAVLVTLAPPLSPLVLGVLMSGDMLIDGLYLRRLSE